MMNFLKFKPKQIKTDLVDIESILQSSLRPVSPRPEFIQSLHKGLMEYTFPLPDASAYDLRKTIIFAVFGFSSMVLALSLWVRLILVILSALGMIRSSKDKRTQF